MSNLIKYKLSTRDVALLLLGFGFLSAVIGYVNSPDGYNIHTFITDFYANASTEFVSIAITVLVIDTLNKRHDREQRKEDLIFQMSSPDNGIAREALRNLRRNSWLYDGSLDNADLVYTNLEGASLNRANLENTLLSFANLKNVKFGSTNLKNSELIFANLKGAIFLTDDQLKSVRALRGAIMPDGFVYDGRFNLEGDLNLAKEEGIDTSDKKELQLFYSEARNEYHSAQLYE